MKREKGNGVFSLIKMRPMLPTLRERKRYLVYEVISKKVTKKDAENSIKQALKQLVGDLGTAKAGIRFLPDWKNNKGIIRVNNKETDKVKASLTLIKEINKEKAIVKSIGLSGTLEKARSKYL